MIKLIRYVFTNDEVLYKYYPEGQTAYGIASINRHTGEFKILQKAPADHRIFQDMAYSRLKKYFRNNEYPNEDMVACY